jgi:hypothetical protein
MQSIAREEYVQENIYSIAQMKPFLRSNSYWNRLFGDKPTMHIHLAGLLHYYFFKGNGSTNEDSLILQNRP